MHLSDMQIRNECWTDRESTMLESSDKSWRLWLGTVTNAGVKLEIKRLASQYSIVYSEGL